MPFDAGSIEAELLLRRDQFNRELDAARADAERFASGDYQAKAGVNAADAQRTIDEVRAAINQLEADRANPHVHIDDKEALAQLAELHAKLKELGGEDFDIPTDKAKEHLKELKDKADEAKGAAGGGGALGLSTAIVGLGSAAIPVLGVTAAGVGLLAAPLTAATLGFSSLGLVALPVMSDVKNALAQIASGQVTLAQLPPDLAQIVSGIQGFKNEWSLLASKLQPDILGVMNTGFSTMRSLLPQLIAPAHEAALAIGDIGQRAQAALAGPAWHGWVTEMTSQVRPAIDSIIRSFANLGAGLGGLLNAFMPFVGSFEAGMVRITNSFRLWGENLGTTQGFQSFMQWVKDNAGPVGNLLKQVGDAFVNLSTALSGLGGVELRVIDSLLGFVNALLKIPGLGPIIADIGVLAFTAAKLAPAFEAVSAALVGFAAKTDVLLATRIGVWLTDAAVGAGLFAQGLSIAGAATLSLEALMGPLGIALAALAAGYGYLVAQQSGATAQAQIVANAMDSQSQATLHSANTQADYQDAINQSNAALIAFTHDFDTHGRSVAENDAITKQLNDTWQQTTKESNNATAALRLIDTQLGLTDEQTSALARSLNVDLTKTAPADALQRLRAALQSDATQAGLTTTAFAELAAGAGKSTSDIAKAVAAAGTATQKAFSQADDIVKAFGSSTLPVTALQIKEFYGKATSDASSFSTNINKAIQAGYDPALISRILQAGPAAAGPLLQGMVSNSSATMVKMVNDSENALSDLNQKAVQMQRLTTLAVQSGTNTMANDLKLAMQAEQTILAGGGTASVAAMANAMHVAIPQLAGVLHEFGIHFTLSADDIKAIALAGGQDAARNIAEALANGRPLTEDQLNLLKFAFQNNADAVAGAGHDAGARFGDGLTNEMRDRLAALGVVMSAYDATIQGGVNPILSTVGGQPVNLSPQQSHDIIGLPGKATGGMLVDHPMFALGEQAPAHPEVVIATNPAYHARNVGLWQTAGKMLGLASGGFMDPSQVPAPNDPAFFAYGGPGGTFGGGTDALAHKVFDATKAFVAQQAASRAAASSGSPTGPAPPGAVTDWINAGIALKNGDPGWAGPLYGRAMQESGGNPHAINLTDINAQQGHPSKGLMQMIDSTFASYMLPGHGDIWNPIDNVASAIGYMLGVYHHVVGPSSSGYAKGGILGIPTSVMDSGGVLPPGQAAINLSPRSEAVIPLGQGGAFGGTVHIDARIVFQGDVTENIDARIQRAQQEQAQKINRGLELRGIRRAPGGVLR